MYVSHKKYYCSDVTSLRGLSLHRFSWGFISEGTEVFQSRHKPPFPLNSPAKDYMHDPKCNNKIKYKKIKQITLDEGLMSKQTSRTDLIRLCLKLLHGLFEATP